MGCGQVAEPGRTLRPDLKVSFVTGYAENATLGNGHLDPGMKVIGRSFPGAGVQKIAGTKLVVMRCNAPLTFGMAQSPVMCLRARSEMPADFVKL